TTASFVSGEYFGLAIKLHLTQLGVQLLGCSPAAPPGKDIGHGGNTLPGLSLIYSLSWLEWPPPNAPAIFSPPLSW
ncbi:TPA: hypothetical protein ACXF7H_005103, partial [Klebsiella pneumoniae]